MKELLKELFEQYYKDVYVYLYSLCQDASLAEDLTSEVFLEVVKSIATFRGESNIKTWLFSIARHRWYAYLRNKKKKIQTESIHTLYDSNFRGIEKDLYSSECEQVLQSILNEEAELHRKVFRMRLDGYSYYEIGLACNISENSARVLFFRIKAKIKQIFVKEGILL